MTSFFVRKYRQVYLALLEFFNASDEHFTKVKYYHKTNEKLNLDSPKDFMHKIQWLKLYKYTEEYGHLVDKYLVRDYVKEKIGEQYLNELLGVYEQVEDIDFDKLPSKFVAKVSHGSGYNIIVTNKELLDIEKTKKQLKKFQGRNYYKKNRERIYKDLKPYIIIEKFLEQTEEDHIVDYKFYCFNGVLESVLVKTYCQDKHKNCRFTLDWNRIEGDANTKNYLSREMEKPSNLEEMIELATKLSQGFKFIRVDLYNIKGKVYFGELTFFPQGGMKRLSVERLNSLYGEKIILN